MQPDDPRWLRFRDVVGREPTRIEEELAIYLIRHGEWHVVERIIFGQRPYYSAVHSLRPVEDLILEQWNGLPASSQDLIRSSLRSLLWRIRNETVSGSNQDAYRALHPRLDMDLIIRGIGHAGEVWSEMDAEQRREVREALQRFRSWAMVVQRERNGNRTK